ncbi:hypothetical protein DQ384_08640 [Sphaerisporangium album]|uniref:Glycosyltransferase RgtA/B/C/D-like domain-containing protein n=1 Tax=Sphaerisporangium album TaxID=509200 RepID=A0A367FP70_9ACTN|nr:hypothetical protein DQ384_08640 [Sphaerisporangium album]
MNSTGRGREAWWGLPLAVVAVAVAVGSCFEGLNHDVRYALGGLRAAGRGGFTWAETFVHRPLPYRWFIGGLDSLTIGPVAAREALIRLLTVALVALTAVWLRAALIRQGRRSQQPAPPDAVVPDAVLSRAAAPDAVVSGLSRGEATAVAFGAGLALALAPAWDLLQPEWVAALFATAGVAATLWFRRVPVAVLAGGAALALAVLVKYTTAPSAVIALGVVAVLSLRRAVWTAVAGVVLTLAMFGAAVLVESREWRWFTELSDLNSGTPLRTGFGQAARDGLVSALANEALLIPALAMLPVAVLLLTRARSLRTPAPVSDGSRPRGRGRRWAWPLLSTAAVLCVVAALIVQGQWFQYHLAALPVFSAGVWALAVARWTRLRGRPPWVLVTATGVLGLGVPLVSGMPLAWRLAHNGAVYAVLFAFVVVVLAVAAWRARVRGGADADISPTTPSAVRLLSLGVAGLAGLVAVAVPVWPTSPYSFDRTHADFTPSERAAHWTEAERELDRARARIGADTPVMYLAFGDMAYFLGNPTRCRYPSPVFLQRTQYLPEVADLLSFDEALACLSGGDRLVVDPKWFWLPKVDARVRDGVRRNFDCGREALRAAGRLVCSRRR